MLNIAFIRDHQDLIKKDLEKRFQADKIEFLNNIIEHDRKYRILKQKADKLRNKRNILTEEIRQLQTSQENKKSVKFMDKVKEAREVPGKIKSIEDEMAVLMEEMQAYISKIPNPTHDSVPIGKTADDNKPFRFSGKPKEFNFELLSHPELLEKTGLANFEAGRENSGQGFNYLIGEMAELDLALQRFGVDFLLSKGFTLIGTPLLLNREALSGAVSLQDFEDVIYKIDKEDLYLIGTGEHPLVGLYKDFVFNKKELPIKICTVTPCFRKEIGGHGVDTKGLFRMHQFNKVEQVIISNQEDSYKLLELMQNISEEFFAKLGIPFRVINICSGDLGAKPSKQYDIEAWFPRQKTYKEVTSCSNTTEYQSSTLNIKYVDGEEKKYVHMLNNTMVATSRAMVAILENYQNKDGTIEIPKALRPYMNGKKKIGGFKNAR